MLHLKKVIRAKPKEHAWYKLETLLTPWGEKLDADHVLEEHPTPQFMRESYQSLNGCWRCAFVNSPHAPCADLESVVRDASIPNEDVFEQEIVVPFSPEAALSGISRQLKPNELLWYKRVFATQQLRVDERLLLHFQAVDYACAVYVNSSLVGTHKGGYEPFSFDISAYLVDAENELVVCVADASEYGGYLRGKQRIDRGGIWYTAQSGIWQSVWLETVPQSYITFARIEANADGVLAVGARFAGVDLAAATPPETASVFRVDVIDNDGTTIATTSCDVVESTCAVALVVRDAELWSPDTPRLYQLRLSFGNDEVMSYCAFRSVEMRVADDGFRRVFLNGEPLFIKGVLDQGYWSDGMMTPPADEALAFDIKSMREAGYNLMRKHIKLECERWYYHCDRLGMLVLQDMVSGGGANLRSWQFSYKPTLFRSSWKRMRDTTPINQEKLGAGSASYREEWTRTCKNALDLLGNHPCIIGWSLMNEGWGQFNARAATDMVRALDPSRLIDSVSGWYDQNCGDFRSVHNYFRDLAVWRGNGKRAFFISEFGGLTLYVKDHSSLEMAYGYESFDNAQAWCEAYRELIAEVESLECKGLAGYVYTQASDIEEETNGILSYDRRVNKLHDC